MQNEAEMEGVMQNEAEMEGTLKNDGNDFPDDEHMGHSTGSPIIRNMVIDIANKHDLINEKTDKKTKKMWKTYSRDLVTKMESYSPKVPKDRCREPGYA